VTSLRNSRQEVQDPIFISLEAFPLSSEISPVPVTTQFLICGVKCHVLRAFVAQTRPISLRFTVKSLPHLYKHLKIFSPTVILQFVSLRRRTSLTVNAATVLHCTLDCLRPTARGHTIAANCGEAEGVVTCRAKRYAVFRCVMRCGLRTGEGEGTSNMEYQNYRQRTGVTKKPGYLV
jgi:hypothetical protein